MNTTIRDIRDQYPLTQNAKDYLEVCGLCVRCAIKPATAYLKAAGGHSDAVCATCLLYSKLGGRDAKEIMGMYPNGEKMSNWQPIATAPRDGKTIFIWYGGECVQAAYLGEWYGRIPNWYLLDKWRNWGPVSDPPKWWMPLPDPPEGK
jgi:hypothetical protein